MAVDVTVTDVSSGYNRSAINENFEAIETALQDAVSRSGNTPNDMDADLDMDSNDILNVNTINVSALKLGGTNITTSELFELATDIK